MRSLVRFAGILLLIGVPGVAYAVLAPSLPLRAQSFPRPYSEMSKEERSESLSGFLLKCLNLSVTAFERDAKSPAAKPARLAYIYSCAARLVPPDWPDDAKAFFVSEAAKSAEEARKADPTISENLLRGPRN